MLHALSRDNNESLDIAISAYQSFPVPSELNRTQGKRYCHTWNWRERYLSNRRNNWFGVFVWILDGRHLDQSPQQHRPQQIHMAHMLPRRVEDV